MGSNKIKTKYKCKAHITYEFIVTAESAEDAENDVFYKIADDITHGIIPIDIYDSEGCFPIPLLSSLDVVSLEVKK